MSHDYVNDCATIYERVERVRNLCQQIMPSEAFRAVANDLDGIRDTAVVLGGVAEHYEDYELPEPQDSPEERRWIAGEVR